MIKGIIFDIDGTLYDYGKAHSAGLEAMRKVLEIPRRRFLELREAAKVRMASTISGAMVHDKYLQAQIILEMEGRFSPSLALRAGKAYWSAFLSTLKRDKRLVSMMRNLSKRYVLAAVSNLYPEIQFRKLERLGLSRFFRVVVTSAEVDAEKPSHVPYSVALMKMRLKPEEVVVVGDDEEDDILGAKVLGMRAVIIGESKIADASVKSIYEVEGVLHGFD